MTNHPPLRSPFRFSSVTACAVALLAAVPSWLGVARQADAVTTTYSGPTGAFTIGLGDTALLVNGASITGDVTNNGILEFGLTTGLTVSNVISGSGAVLLTGTGGIITFSGSNSYAGGTTVRYGELIITPGGVIYHPTENLEVGLDSGENGFLQVAGGMVTSFDGNLGRNAGSTGTALVTSGTWANTQDLNIGYQGSGSLTITGEGRVSAVGTTILGRDAGSSGSLLVTGGGLDVGGEVQVGFGGAGTMTVNGGHVSTQTGKIGVNAGSSGTATVTSGTWTVAGNLAVGFEAGAGTLNISGGGVVSVGDALDRGTFGTINLTSGGRLLIGTGTNTGDLFTNLVNDGTVEFNRSDLSEYTYLLSGTGNVFKRGAGTLRLTGSNSYSGGTTILGGTIEVANSAWINHSSAAIDVGSSSGASGGLDVTGGNVAASVLNLYNGTFSMSTPDAMVTTGTAYVGTLGTGTATISGGMWSILNELYVGSSGTGAMDVTGGTVSSVNTTIGALSGDSGSLTVTTSGVFNSSGQFVVGGSGTGSLTISSGGEVYVTGTLSKGAGGTINLNSGGTLFIGTGGTTGALSADLANNGSLVFNRSNDSTYAGAVSGGGTVNKRGGGALSLSGTSTYSGNTFVEAGSLYVDGRLGDTQVTVQTGATLGGVGTVEGHVNVDAGGILSPGSLVSEIASFKVGSLSLADGSTTRMTVSGTTAGISYDQIAGLDETSTIVYGGTLELTLSGSYADYTTFQLFSNFTDRESGNFGSVTLNATGAYASLNGAFTFVAEINSWVSGWTSGNQQLQFNVGTGQLIVVPEPGTMVMAAVGVGLGGLLMQRRRQRRRAARDEAAAGSRGQ